MHDDEAANHVLLIDKVKSYFIDFGQIGNQEFCKLSNINQLVKDCESKLLTLSV